MTRKAFGAEFVGVEGFWTPPRVECRRDLSPRFVAAALRDGLRLWEQGRLEVATFDEMRASRDGYAALIGVDERRVAMGSSVSGLIGLVASSIPDGSRVATLHDEFTSVTFPFAAQSGRGVTVTELSPGQLEHAAGDFDVVAANLVQSADGAVLDVESLRQTVAESGTITVIDTTQALGWKNIELPWADVAVAASYKWLLGPRGVAWMSVSERMLDALVPHAANPYAAEDLWSSLYGLPLRLAHGARRFDSSPVWFSVLGAGLSLPWVASLDRRSVEAHTLSLANQLRTELNLPTAVHPSSRCLAQRLNPRDDLRLGEVCVTEYQARRSGGVVGVERHEGFDPDPHFGSATHYFFDRVSRRAFARPYCSPWHCEGASSPTRRRLIDAGQLTAP